SAQPERRAPHSGRSGRRRLCKRPELEGRAHRRRYRSPRGTLGWCYLMAFLSAAPAVNLGTREAGIWIFSPVAGLRPSRALRCETLNLPKPENVTSLPRFSAPSIVSSIASTASPASFLLNPARSATWSTNSDFVTCSSFKVVGKIDANRVGGQQSPVCPRPRSFSPLPGARRGGLRRRSSQIAKIACWL